MTRRPSMAQQLNRLSWLADLQAASAPREDGGGNHRPPENGGRVSNPAALSSMTDIRPNLSHLQIDVLE